MLGMPCRHGECPSLYIQLYCEPRLPYVFMKTAPSRPAPTSVDPSNWDSANLSIRQQNCRAILAAAGDEFAAKGFAATRTEDIARRAGLPKANVYYYFQSKENLYRQVLHEVIQPFLQASALLRPEDEPRAALSAYIRARLGIAERLPSAFRVFIRELMHGGAQLPDNLRQTLEAETQRQLACLRQWIDSGRLARLNPQHLLLTLWSATQTYVDFGWQIGLITGRGEPGPEDFERAVQTLVRLLLDGVGLPSSRLRPLPL
ncbi:MAG: HTH-type transcriptional regulator RutR [Pseudomonas citronellolis]|nr:MAG: HTH-type transcriptional regulator RutR [Pseudomonas citronellolis]